MHTLRNLFITRCRLIALSLLVAPIRSKHSLKKYGNPGAAWWVPTHILKPNTVVYSGGIGTDYSFEEALVKNHHCDVFCYDPTPAAIAHIQPFQKNKRVHFQPWGLWNRTATLKFYMPANPTHVSHSVVNLQKTNEFFKAPCKSVKTIMRFNKHTAIDLLKIDIEGAEYAVLNSLLEDKIFPKVICVEFDQPATLQSMLQMIRKLQKAGYQLIKQDYFNFTFSRE